MNSCSKIIEALQVNLRVYTIEINEFNYMILTLDFFMRYSLRLSYNRYL